MTGCGTIVENQRMMIGSCSRSIAEDVYGGGGNRLNSFVPKPSVLDPLTREVGTVNFVQPIRDREMIELVKDYFKAQSYRNYMMFVFGINTGLRIQDILKFQVKDAIGDQIVMYEMKTGKRKIIEINPKLQREIKKYVTQLKMQSNDYLFPSRQGGQGKKPIKRDMAYKIMRAAAKEFGLVDIGTHTMRKTFGYHLYDKTKDITLVRKMLNHSDDSSTMSYIGLDQDAMNKAMKQFSL